MKSIIENQKRWVNCKRLNLKAWPLISSHRSRAIAIISTGIAVNSILLCKGNYITKHNQSNSEWVINPHRQFLKPQSSRQDIINHYSLRNYTLLHTISHCNSQHLKISLLSLSFKNSQITICMSTSLRSRILSLATIFSCVNICQCQSEQISTSAQYVYAWMRYVDTQIALFRVR